MKKLASDLDDPKLSSEGLAFIHIDLTITKLAEDRDAALEELKIYGRDPRNSDPIFTKEVGYCAIAVMGSN